MWLWLVAVIGAAAGTVALWRARRLSRRLAEVSQAYWELRYEYTRLRAQVNRLDPGRQAEPAAGPPEPPQESFVPLSALKMPKS